MAPLHLLAVTTKPPWPPVGGGNLVVHNLLSGLVDRGADVTVLTLAVDRTGLRDAPYAIRAVPARPRRPVRSAHHLLVPPPTALARYRVPELRVAVCRELESRTFDVVHLEQLHLAWLVPDVRKSAPAVLRQQNVESRLLQRFARLRPVPMRWALLREARRTRRAERRACLAADLVAAISPTDAEVLTGLSGGDNVRLLPASVGIRAPGRPPRLAGRPALICMGSFDWAPNRDGARWFLDRVWPVLRRSEPEAVLHLAGPGSRDLVGSASSRVLCHGVVDEPGALYDPHGIVVVPVRAGSGVRLRILESWAAGVPVVATDIGAEGLASGPSDGVLVASDAAELARQIVRAAGDRELRRRLTERGRDRLAEHAPKRTADTAIRLYREAAALWSSARERRG